MFIFPKNFWNRIKIFSPIFPQNIFEYYLYFSYVSTSLKFLQSFVKPIPKVSYPLKFQLIFVKFCRTFLCYYFIIFSYDFLKYFFLINSNSLFNFAEYLSRNLKFSRNFWYAGHLRRTCIVVSAWGGISSLLCSTYCRWMCPVRSSIGNLWCFLMSSFSKCQA